jgi:uncharacterized membrane protein YqhA
MAAGLYAGVIWGQIWLRKVGRVTEPLSEELAGRLVDVLLAGLSTLSCRPVGRARHCSAVSSARGYAGLANDGDDMSRNSEQTDDAPETVNASLPGHGILGMTRFIIVLAIIGIGLSSAVMLIYAIISLGRAMFIAFRDSHFDIEGVQHLALELIELTDFFLLGMVLYVVAIGMYELFIDPNIPVPDWMRVQSLDDLKTQIVNVVIVMLIVTFLGVALSTKQGGLDFLYFGLAIAVVVIAVSFFNWVHHKGGKH